MPAAGRLGYLDLLRGWAVLFMFETHAYQAWCSPAAKKGLFYDYTRLVGGLAAPLFLFLAGLSIVLMESSLRRKGAPAIGSRLLKRGLLILAAAFLFRLQAYAFQYGHAKVQTILRVDILNCIGLGLLAVAVVLITASEDRRSVVFAGLATIVVLSTPVVYETDLTGRLPWLLAAYINGRPPIALFPLFPWIGFTLAGAALGVLILRSRAEAVPEARFMFALTVASLFAIALSAMAERAPWRVYHHSEFWLTSPQYFVIRLGVMGLLMAGCWMWRHRFPAPRFSVVERLGRHSLLMYWVHVEIVYGRFTRSLKGREDIISASLWLIALTALMLALSFVPEKWKEWRRARDSRPGLAHAV